MKKREKQREQALEHVYICVHIYTCVCVWTRPCAVMREDGRAVGVSAGAATGDEQRHTKACISQRQGGTGPDPDNSASGGERR